MSLSDHAKRDKSGILNPKRNPAAVTDDHSTGTPPEAGTHSGGVVKTGSSHAGAGGKGVS